MIVYEIKPNGFCGGVKRAINIINNTIKSNNTPKPIYMFGNLVHNIKIVNSYKNDVIYIKDNYNENLDKIEFGTIIFTAHGIDPHIKEKALIKGLNVVDTTCPKVLNIQTLIENKLKDGYEIIIVGNKNHPEVLGYLGISPNIKMYSPDMRINNKTFAINQTTLVYNDVLKIYNELISHNPSIEISEEICSATRTRQEALESNMRNFDAVIVIGDKLSNNCRSLYNILQTNNIRSFFIEDISDLNEIDLLNIQCIGVTAGASTPPAIIKEIIDELSTYYPNKVFKTNLKDSDYQKYE